MEDMYVIEMLNITKRFPGIVANDNVTFRLKRGEIHAILGENGAGKSTLMSVLFGMYNAEEGEIKINGKKMSIHNPNDANQYGIGMVHQHFKLVPTFTVLENIILGAEDTRLGVLEMNEARKRVLELSTRYGFDIDLNALIQDITVGMQQRVEILKMLYRKNEVLIFDEPTAVLTPVEIEGLFEIMRLMIREGKSIVFISHKLKEIKQIADVCTVLRRGKVVGTVNVAETSVLDMSNMMVGRNVTFSVEKELAQPGIPILEIKNLTVCNEVTKKKKVSDVSFTVRSGEIVCIAGVENNGQQELVQAITGLGASESGQIILNGEDITRATVRYRNTHGISHIPEDRQKFGIILDFDMANNMVMNEYFTAHFQKHGFLRFHEIYKYGDELVAKYDIRSSYGAKTRVRIMSGGNQQKVIIAREVDRAHNVLVAVQPTRGLDVGAIEYIHKQLVQERDKGQAVLLISLELDEVMDVSDRILVIYEGEIVADVDPKQVTVEELGLYMTGTRRDDA